MTKTINEEILAERVASVLGQDLFKVQKTAWLSLIDQLVTSLEKLEEIPREHFETAKANGISRKNVIQRYWDYGWKIERAITEPIRVSKNTEEWLQWKETATNNGITNPTFISRRRKGMTPEEAATVPLNKRNTVATKMKV